MNFSLRSLKSSTFVPSEWCEGTFFYLLVGSIAKHIICGRGHHDRQKYHESETSHYSETLWPKTKFFLEMLGLGLGSRLMIGLASYYLSVRNIKEALKKYISKKNG